MKIIKCEIFIDGKLVKTCRYNDVYSFVECAKIIDDVKPSSIQIHNSIVDESEVQ